jgi:signal transduction histidine kinase
LADDDRSLYLSGRNRAEAVGETQELLRLVLATLPVGVAVIDRSGDVVLTNAAAKIIWGDMIFSGQERYARSRAFWHASGKPIAPTEWASVRAVREGKTSLNELIDIETFDGQRKTIQNSAVPIHDADGLIVGSVVVNEDVTERVRTEVALRESTERLQHFSRRLLTVQEEERRHLSRELHDEFGQLLAGITLHLQAAKSLASDRAVAPRRMRSPHTASRRTVAQLGAGASSDDARDGRFGADFAVDCETARRAHRHSN